MDTLFNKLIKFSATITKAYEDSLEDVLKKYSLNQNEARVLLFINNNDTDNTAQDISKYRLISKSLISKSINNLKDKELLITELDPVDKRIKRLFLTENAQPIINDLVHAQSVFNDITEIGFSKRDIEKLESLLAKLYSNVINKTDVKI